MEQKLREVGGPIRVPSGHRPGLPRKASWYAGLCWQQRIQLVFRSQFEQHQRHALGVQHGGRQSRQHAQPRLRSSVALPLGINGDKQHVNTDYNIVELCAAGASVDATSIAKWRPYAGGGSGPRDPKGRKSNNLFTAQDYHVRPVAHPLERLRRWATGPAP